MVEARKDDDERPVADAAADLSRFAESSTKLFAEQAAVLAVMTAYGMSVAAQMTGMMLSSLRGPADASEMPVPEQKAEPAEQKPTESTQPSSAKVLPLRPRAETATIATADVVAKPEQRPARTAKAKVASAKPSPVKAKPSPAKAKTSTKAEPAKVASIPPASIGADDLKKISGIGPRLEQVLHDRGIATYADVAALSKAALKKLDTELGLEGRVVRDDWAGQAKALSGGKG